MIVRDIKKNIKKDIECGIKDIIKNELYSKYHSSFTETFNEYDNLGLPTTYSAVVHVIRKIIHKKYPNSIRKTRYLYTKEGDNEIHDEYLYINSGVYYILADPKTMIKISVKRKIDKSDDNDDTKATDISKRIYITFDFVGVNHLEWCERVSKKITEYYNRLLDAKRRNKNEISMSVWRSGKLRNTSRQLVTMDKVIVRNKEDILNQINAFLTSKGIYAKYNINYRLGILLYGKPGTGKSSFILALSHYLRMRIVCLTVEDIWKSSNYRNTILVFEELDTYFYVDDNLENRESHKTRSQINIRSFLLGIDSIGRGNIVIATTNNIDRLDIAVIRDGRFDMKILFDDFNKEEACEMIRFFDDDPEDVFKLINIDENGKINPAKLENVLRNRKLKTIIKEG